MNETLIVITLPFCVCESIIQNLVLSGDYINACKFIMQVYNITLLEAVNHYKSLDVYKNKKEK